MASRFVSRSGPPRVHIDYPDPSHPDQRVELPFVIGVMADLSGNASGAKSPNCSAVSSST